MKNRSQQKRLGLKTIWSSFRVMIVFTGVVTSIPSAFAQFANDPTQQAIMAIPLQKSHAAIDQCRAQRLQGQIASYKDSALCSNPQVFAAWQEAKYPYMDLITVWLGARVAGSERVDQGIVTPEVFEEQMAELTNRLTLEERRRTASPPSQQVSDAVEQRPSSQTYLAGLSALETTEPEITIANSSVTAPTSSRNARSTPEPARTIIRERAARIEPVSLTRQQLASTSSTAVTRTSSNRSTINEASAQPVGKGGPFVPAAYVQISAHRNKSDAQAALASLESRYPTILVHKETVVRRADLGDKGIFYRAQIGPVSSEKAERVCTKLKAAGTDCFLQYN